MADFSSRMGPVHVDYIVLGEKSISIIIKGDLARQSVQQNLLFNVPDFIYREFLTTAFN